MMRDYDVVAVGSLRGGEDSRRSGRALADWRPGSARRTIRWRCPAGPGHLSQLRGQTGLGRPFPITYREPSIGLGSQLAGACRSRGRRAGPAPTERNHRFGASLPPTFANAGLHRLTGDCPDQGDKIPGCGDRQAARVGQRAGDWREDTAAGERGGGCRPGDSASTTGIEPSAGSAGGLDYGAVAASVAGRSLSGEGSPPREIQPKRPGGL